MTEKWMRLALLFLVALLLAACASKHPLPNAPLYKPLPKAAYKQIERIDVLVGVGQSGLLIADKNTIWQPVGASRAGMAVVSTPRMGDPGGGSPQINVPNVRTAGDAVIVVGALLIIGTFKLVQMAGEKGYDEFRYFMADRALAPIRRNIDEASFGDRLREALRGETRFVAAMNNGTVELVAPATPAHFESRYATADGDAVLVVALNYTMSVDLNTLTVAAEANLYPRTAALWKQQYNAYRKGSRTDILPGAMMTDVRHSLYRNVISYTAALPDKVEDRDKAAAAWAAFDGERIRGALDEGLAVISRLLAADFVEGTPPPFGNIELNGHRMRVVQDHRGVTQVSRIGN